jgi:DNA helicase HerA-like ATPase
MPDDEANTLAALIAIGLHEHRLAKKKMSSNPHLPDPLDFLLVIDEAHRVLPGAPERRGRELNPGPAEEVSRQLCRLIAEIRSFGVGVIVGEQSIEKLARDVLVNTSCKVVHRVVDGHDRSAIARTLALADDDADMLGYLDVGESVVMMPSTPTPLSVKISQPRYL